MGAMVEDVGAVKHGSGQGSYNTPRSKRDVARVTTKIRPPRCCQVFGALDLINFIIERGLHEFALVHHTSSSIQPQFSGVRPANVGGRIPPVIIGRTWHIVMAKRLVIFQLNARHSVAVLDLVGQVLLKEKLTFWCFKSLLWPWSERSGL